MAFELPELPYALNALEPVISQRTLEFHYGKHHQAYVNNLNKLIAGTDLEGASLEEIIMKADGGIYNNAAQVWNHTFYFEALTPNQNEDIPMPLKNLIDENFGSWNNFKEEFLKAAATLFGSGWVWLVKDAQGKLSIVKESNAGNPMLNGLTPLMTLDVWEHAYYLDYQNKRPDYLNAAWTLINWQKINERLG